MRKKILATVLTCALISTFTLGVYAEDALTYIQAVINDSVSLMFNGEEVTPVNVNGEEVPILLYQGSSYLPVRSVATLAGLNVGWDNETKSIMLAQQTPVVPADATTILDLRLEDRVFVNTYGDNLDSSNSGIVSDSLLNEVALLTREDGTVMNPGLLLGENNLRLQYMLQFNENGEMLFSSTTVNLNGEFTKVTGYVKRKSIDTGTLGDGEFSIHAIDADMTLVNVPYGPLEAGLETEFVYFEANVTGMNQIAFLHGNENGHSDDCQYIVGDLLFFK